MMIKPDRATFDDLAASDLVSENRVNGEIRSLGLS